MLSRKPVPSVLVLGAGAWAKKYADALRPRAEAGECVVTFCYDSRAGKGILYPRDYHRYLRTVLSNVVEFENWRNGCCVCMDVSDPVQRRQVLQWWYSVAYVVTPDATHCAWARSLLGHAEQIVVEKPFDVSTANIDRLLRKLRPYRDAVWGFDHYLVRAHQFTDSGKAFPFLDFLEEVREFRFHMLEHTDGDLERRAAALQNGLIFDMASHAPPLLLPFGLVESIRVTGLHAALCDSAVRFMRPQAGLKGGRETFAWIEIEFAPVRGPRPAKGRIVVGKYVGSADEKFVEVVGAKGKRIYIDLVDYMVNYVEGGEKRPVTPLAKEPVGLLVRETLQGRPLKSLFTPDRGRTIVGKLQEWCQCVEQRLRAAPLAGYRKGAPARSIRANPGSRLL